MPNLVNNKVVMPKNIFLDYFCVNSETKDYDVIKLASDIKTWRYPIYYNNNTPYIEYGDMVELYFDNRWDYPIDSIINLFNRVEDPTNITWYCREEFSDYVSRFTSQDNEIQEEVYFVYHDEDYIRLFDEYLERDDRYYDYPGFTDILWYYHPEIRWGWQKVKLNTNLDLYQHEHASKTDFDNEHIFPPVSFHYNQNNLRFYIENYIPTISSCNDDKEINWVRVSWEIRQNGECRPTDRLEALTCQEVNKISQLLNDLKFGRLKEQKHLTFRKPELTFCFNPGNSPSVRIKFLHSYSEDHQETYSFKFSHGNLDKLTKYFNRLTNGRFTGNVPQ